VAFSSAGWTGILTTSLRSCGIEEATFDFLFDSGLFVLDGEVLDFFLKVVRFGWVRAWSFGALVEPLDLVGDGSVGAGC
jgi:hypothetical protein